MKAKLWIAAAVVSAALSAAGCAGRRALPETPPPPPPPPLGAVIAPSGHAAGAPERDFGYRCAPGTACAPRTVSPHRQYYDQHHRRYYYYDPMKRRYYWENGDPKR